MKMYSPDKKCNLMFSNHCSTHSMHCTLITAFWDLNCNALCLSGLYWALLGFTALPISFSFPSHNPAKAELRNHSFPLACLLR